MIFDLAEGSAGTVTADIAIVGAGIAGLFLADRLRASGLRVAVVESGGRAPTDGAHPLNRVVQRGALYRGAEEGRARSLGGTSTRWGGALIPLLDHDLAPRPYLDLPGWPVSAGALRRYLPEVESRFGVNAGPYDEEFVHDADAGKTVPTNDRDMLARFAKWPRFKNRNVASLFRTRIDGDPGLAVWVNATATGFDLDEPSGRLRAITAQGPGGRALRVEAPCFVLCAGAIEATRLLLLLDRQYRGRPFAECAALGRYFNDHVSRHLADIAARDVTRLNRMAGFRFAGATMRSLRYELAPAAQEIDGVGSAFGHIAFTTDDVTGFDAARTVLRALQKSGRLDMATARRAVRVFRDAPYLVKAAMWRYGRRQLYWPQPARYQLHVVCEQIPDAASRVTLAADTDPFGRPLGAVDWRIAERDWHTFTAYKNRFGGFWARHGLAAIGDLAWLGRGDDFSGVSTSDVFHPCGSTRMGSDGRSAVVNADLRTFAVPNLWVASTSVFPSGGSANPTLTLLLLTLRLGDHLAAAAARLAA